MLAYDENGKMREFQEYEQHPVPVPGKKTYFYIFTEKVHQCDA